MKIAILGAGIGGLTMAQCLFKLGYDFDLYESSESIKPVGAGIWMPPNAMQVFVQLKKAHEVMARGVSLENMRVLDLNLKKIGLVEGARLASRYQFPTVSIKRHELHSLLFQELPSKSVHLGHRCLEVKTNNLKSILRFNGGIEAEYDLVIAADGIHSIARKAIGDNRPLQYSGQTCLRGITKLEIPVEIQRRSIEIWGNGARFGCSPVGANEIYWYAPLVYPSGQALSSNEWLELLKKKYLKFPKVVQQILDATSAEHLIHTDLFELPPSNNWGAPGLILLGDATHAMTPNLGQGAAMAVEDAYELSLILQKKNLTPLEVASNFLQTRVSRVNQIAAWSRQLGSLGAWQNPLLCLMRNSLLSHTPQFLQQRQIDFIYSFDRNL